MTPVAGSSFTGPELLQDGEKEERGNSVIIRNKKEINHRGSFIHLFPDGRLVACRPLC
jgi:hypothetical protein